MQHRLKKLLLITSAVVNYKKLMRVFLLIILLPAIILATALKAGAQQGNTGSFGDPVFTQDFGAGAANPQNQGIGSQTNMAYTTGCPNDGQYTIINSLNNSNNCHTDTWQNVLQDHTGNSNGYMMLVNAAITPAGQPPNVFFTQTVPTGTLCPNTTYQFSAYILNLIKYSQRNGNIEPDIVFSVTTSDGSPIGIPYDTGPIPSNNPNNPTTDPAWKQFTLQFTTPPGVTSVIVSMTNNANGGTGNDFLLDDITFRAYGPIVSAGFNNVSSTQSLSLCQGGVANLTLQSSIVPGVYANPSFQWQQNINGAAWVDLPGKTSTSLTLNFTPAVGNYQYRVGVAEGNNITSVSCRVYSDPLIMSIYPNPVVTGINPVSPPVCEGETLTLAAGGGTNYDWTWPDGHITHDNPLVIPSVSLTDAGTYKVITYSQYGCQSQQFSTQVNINPKVTAAATGSTTICENTSTTLHASGGTQYSWSPGNTLSDSTSANPVASPTDTTTYKVTAGNGFCTDVASVTVNVLKEAVANAGTDKIIFEGQSVQLTASEEYGNVFYWTPTTALSDPNILNPVANPVDDITYTLHVTSTSNCGINTSSVFVKVYKKITIPNTFSPNNDGINDTWDIDALITYPDCVLSVFDRYGQQVYHTIGYNTPWNGLLNGQPLPPGTYYYVLDLKNNTPKMSGWVLIVR
jgi:gliding motility-associated-like protein